VKRKILGQMRVIGKGERKAYLFTGAGQAEV
jgi:hypothetical protein